MDAVVRTLLENPRAGEQHIFPFLWIHGEPEETIREYMGAIHRANTGAVCVESRPHPDFLGPQWWHDMDIVLDEARKRGMKIWILDDSHFPTGYANGALENQEAQLCRQSLVCQVLGEVSAGKRLAISLEKCSKLPDWTPNLNEQYTMDMESLRHFEDDFLLGVAAVRLGGIGQEDILDLTKQVRTGRFSFAPEDGTWRVYALHLTWNRGPHRSYINMMNRISCRVLLDTVYEPHWQRYQADFGTTIAGFFSDEPEIGNGHLYESGKRLWEMDDQAWSDEVEVELRAALGGNFPGYLPLLWEQDFDGGKAAEVRQIYMDAVTKAVRRDFSSQIGDWCRERGVQYIGHLIEDNNQHFRCGSSLGHYFRGLWGQDMAGIDCIGGQVLPQGEWDGPYGLMGEHRSGLFYHYVLGKLGASLAAIDPKKQGRCMCEIFGNYGWEEGLRLEKYLTDHFLVQGVNHFVPHAFSPKEYPDPDCPPHFYAHGNNPQYRHFGALMGYMGRLCKLFSGGRQDAPAAILYNAEGDWTGECMMPETVAQPLAEAQIDCHFLPLDDLEKAARYRVLLIPGSDFLPGRAAEVLEKLDIPAAFVGRRPVCVREAGDMIFAKIPVIQSEEIPAFAASAGAKTIRLEPQNKYIRCMRYLAETERYFFVNESTERYEGRVQVPSAGPCYAYNAWDDRLERVEAGPQDGGTMLQLSLAPSESLTVIFDTPEGELAAPVTPEGRCERLDSGWTRSICRSIDYPDFREEKEVILPDTLAEEQPKFSGFVRYKRRYQWDHPAEKAVLEITDAYEGVEVFVNGQSLGIQILPPFRYDLSSALRIGDNQLRIEAATTLERENAGLPDMIRQYLGLGEKQPACPSGINGEVRIWKK